MNRTGSAAAVVLLVLLTVTAPALGAADTFPAAAADGTTRWQQTTTVPADGNETAPAANETSPGARLGGVVAAQGVAVGTELESRSLAYQLNQSGSNASKAAVLARQVNQSERRLDTLQAERTALDAAYENGTISEHEYRVRATRLSAQITAVRRLTTQTATAAEPLPPETLRRNGVNVTALQSLRARADRAEGPRIASIAREIAGPPTGFGPSEAPGQRGRNGTPGDGNASRPGERGGEGNSRAGPPDERGPDSSRNETAGQSGTDRNPGPDDNAANQGRSNNSSAANTRESDGDKGSDQSGSDNNPGAGNGEGEGNGNSSNAEGEGNGNSSNAEGEGNDNNSNGEGEGNDNNSNGEGEGDGNNSGAGNSEGKGDGNNSGAGNSEGKGDGNNSGAGNSEGKGDGNNSGAGNSEGKGDGNANGAGQGQ